MTLRGGRYERLRPIASGGMATVYLGRAHGMGVGGFERQVAIKVMHAHLADAPEFVAMFLDEARLAARIRHPNVVSTLDAVRDEHGLFLVMDYVEGVALHRLQKVAMQEGTRLPFDVSARILVDALSGLHAAHELSADDGSPLHLVHRDVSPQNIMLSVGGVASITDFGIARAESRASQTRTGELKGKIAYMSPEQIQSHPVDRRSDVYAAGVIFWELLVGRRLFKAESDAALTFQVVAGAQQSPAEAADVPPAISAVCMRALAVDPRERYASAAELAEAIEDAAHRDGFVLAKPRVVGEHVKRALASATPTSQVTGQPLGLAAPAVVAEATGPTAGPSVLSAQAGGGTGRRGRRPVVVAGAIGATLVGVAVVVAVLRPQGDAADDASGATVASPATPGDTPAQAAGGPGPTSPSEPTTAAAGTSSAASPPPPSADASAPGDAPPGDAPASKPSSAALAPTAPAKPLAPKPPGAPATPPAKGPPKPPSTSPGGKVPFRAEEL